MFYGETVLRIHDGVVKQKDVPAKMDDSGVELVGTVGDRVKIVWALHDFAPLLMTLRTAFLAP